MLHTFLHFRWGERDKNPVGISSLRRSHTLSCLKHAQLQVHLIITPLLRKILKVEPTLVGRILKVELTYSVSVMTSMY